MKKILSLIKKGVNAYLNALTKCPYTPTGTIPFGIQFLLFRVDNIIYLGPQLNRLEQLSYKERVISSILIGAANYGGVAGRSMHLAVNQEMKVRFFLPPLWKKLENVLRMA